MRMRNPTQIGEELRAWMRKEGMTEADLAFRIVQKNKDFDISQSWISRIANGRFSRLTTKIRCVTDYANIRVEEAINCEQDAAKVIKTAIDEVWDGSAAHAILIARLIRATRGMLR